MNTIVRSIVVLSLLLLFTAYQPVVASDQKAVLVRKQKDLDALNAIDNIQAIRLDVTVQEEIDAAVETVREGGKGLHGLVNNAGIFIGGPLIEVDVDEIQWLMDVNVYGVVRVTQARITTIGSISGILSGQFSGPYSMSKHAIEAYTDSLATEMTKFDVHVSVIEPGNYDSAIADTARSRMTDDNYFDEDSYYAERRYMVVPSEEEAAWTIGKAIEELVQLNEWQAYSYSREQLIEKLDAAMAPPVRTTD